MIILGGGPAGLSASLWCAELGLRSLLIEKEPELGGQLLRTFNSITNHLGVAATDGLELRDKFVHHLDGTNEQRLTAVSVIDLDLSHLRVTIDNKINYTGKAVILATGVRRRALGVPGEREFSGKGVLDSGVRMKESVTGKVIAIAGGGDAALENAAILSRKAEMVYIVHRRSGFTARKEFIERVENQNNIEFLYNSRIVAILGGRKVDSIDIENLASGRRRRLKADHVLIRIGVEPNTEFLNGQIRLDSSGYIITNEKCETNIAGVYAVGDVANPLSPTISTAVGTGASAVKASHACLTSKS